MGKRVKRILIVGGGASGWLTGAYLATKLGASRPDGVKVTLIESSDIPLVGVGEGTFPTIKRVLMQLRQTEEAFLRGCSGTFKQGIEFVNWTHPPQNGRDSRYYHPFNLPSAGENALDLLPYWLMGVAGDMPFSQAVGFQDLVCDERRAPKQIDGDKWLGPMNYAYHFDAGKLAHYLAGVGQAAGVTRLIDMVETVNLDDQGNIASLTTQKHGDLEADLFVDCTGFRATLIGQALEFAPICREVGDYSVRRPARWPTCRCLMTGPTTRSHRRRSRRRTRQAGLGISGSWSGAASVTSIRAPTPRTTRRQREILRGYLGKDAGRLAHRHAADQVRVGFTGTSPG